MRAALSPVGSSLVMWVTPHRPRWRRLWRKARQVNLGFAQGDAAAQEGALAIGPDAQGDEDGAVEQLAVLPDLFVAGIQDEIGKVAEGALAPLLEFGIQELGARTDLGGTDAGTAEFLDEGGDFARGDALDIHFGQGQFEGLLGADALFPKRWDRNRFRRGLEARGK